MDIAYVTSRPLEINASSSIRNYATVMGLMENGHNVTVITSKPDRTDRGYDDTLDMSSIDTRYIELGVIRRLARVGGGMKFLQPLKRICSYIFQKAEIYDSLKLFADHIDEFDLNEFDLVISSSDPKSSHLFVDRYFEKNGKRSRWIQIWGDPFLSDISREYTLAGRIGREEERLLEKPDSVIYVSRLSCEEQKVRYPKYASKMRDVPIPYLEERCGSRPLPGRVGDVKLCYCGDYYSWVRDITPLYKAVDSLGMQMVILGNTDVFLDGSFSITVKPRQGLSEVREAEDGADVLIHLSNKEGSQIPGKIYQYAATDKPVLFILDGDVEGTRKMFEKYNRFLFVENRQPDIEEVLRNIRGMARRVDCSPIEEFKASNVARKIIGQEIGI